MGVWRRDLHRTRHETHAEQLDHRAIEAFDAGPSNQYADTHALLYTSPAVPRIRDLQRRVDARKPIWPFVVPRFIQ